MEGRLGGTALFKAVLTFAGVLCASTKSHANGKFKNRYFRILRMGSDVFFDANSDSPHMT